MLTEILLTIIQTSGVAIASPPPIQPPSTFHPGVLPATIPVHPSGHLFLSLDETLHSFDHSGTEIRAQKLSPAEFDAARGTSTTPVKNQKPEAADEGICSPPLYCEDNSTCRAPCSACTYVGFFPYGICMQPADDGSN